VVSGDLSLHEQEAEDGEDAKRKMCDMVCKWRGRSRGMVVRRRWRMVGAVRVGVIKMRGIRGMMLRVSMITSCAFDRVDSVQIIL